MPPQSIDEIITAFNAKITEAKFQDALRVTRQEHCVVYGFLRSSDAINRDVLKDHVKLLASIDGHQDAIVDFSQCAGVNSTLLSHLANIIAQVRLHAGHVVVVTAGSVVINTLKIVGFNMLCEVVDSMAAAVKVHQARR